MTKDADSDEIVAHKILRRQTHKSLGVPLSISGVLLVTLKWEKRGCCAATPRLFTGDLTTTTTTTTTTA